MHALEGGVAVHTRRWGGGEGKRYSSGPGCSARLKGQWEEGGLISVGGGGADFSGRRGGCFQCGRRGG